MSAIEIKCPKCGTFYVPDKQAGCPSCATENKSSDSGGPSSTRSEHKVANDGELIECKYCKELIKANAIKCKHCGSLLNETQSKDTERSQSSGVVTIQQTSKGWKTVTLCGLGCIFVLSPLACVSGDVSGGAGIFIFGIVLGLIGKIGAWWFHG